MGMRKVVSFGKSSFVVSLPKTWVTRNNVKKGDELAVDEKTSELVVSVNSPKKRGEPNEMLIDGRKGTDILKTVIISAYINNCGVIRIRDLEKDSLPAVKDILHDLAGMEIIEEDSNSIVAKDLLDISEVSIASIIRRMDLLTRSMIDDSLQQERDLYDSVYERDKEVNRLSWLGFRVSRAVIDNPALLKMFSTTNWNIVLSRQVITQLERVADQTKRIARMLRQIHDKKRKKAFQKNYSLVNQHYLAVMKAYYSKNREEGIFKVEDRSKELLRISDRLCGKYKDVVIMRLSEFLKYIIASTNSILRSIMEREY